MIAELVHIGRLAPIGAVFLAGGAGLLWALAPVLAAWDATTTAVLTGIALGVVGIVAVAWPQLSEAGVKASRVQRDEAVRSATEFYQNECKRLREEREQAHKMFQAELLERDERYRALERDLRLQCQQAESRLQLASSRAVRFETLWRTATGQSLETNGGDHQSQSHPDAPPSGPAIGAKGASS